MGTQEEASIMAPLSRPGMSRLILFPLVTIAIGFVIGFVAWMVNPNADFEKIGQGIGTLFIFSVVFGAIAEHERRKKKAAEGKAVNPSLPVAPTSEAPKKGPWLTWLVLVPLALIGVGLLCFFLHDAKRRLSENLYIETLGGTATPLHLQGAVLPVSQTESFSTAHDNQAFIDIHLLHGHSALASGNETVGRYRIADIPAMERGQPEFSVTFTIDSTGQVQVTANMNGHAHPVKSLTPLPARVAVK